MAQHHSPRTSVVMPEVMRRLQFSVLYAKRRPSCVLNQTQTPEAPRTGHIFNDGCRERAAGRQRGSRSSRCTNANRLARGHAKSAPATPLRRIDVQVGSLLPDVPNLIAYRKQLQRAIKVRGHGQCERRVPRCRKLIKECPARDPRAVGPTLPNVPQATVDIHTEGLECPIGVLANRQEPP